MPFDPSPPFDFFCTDDHIVAKSRVCHYIGPLFITNKRQLANLFPAFQFFPSSPPHRNNHSWPEYSEFHWSGTTQMRFWKFCWQVVLYLISAIVMKCVLRSKNSSTSIRRKVPPLARLLTFTSKIWCHCSDMMIMFFLSQHSIIQCTCLGSVEECKELAYEINCYGFFRMWSSSQGSLKKSREVIFRAYIYRHQHHRANRICSFSCLWCRDKKFIIYNSKCKSCFCLSLTIFIEK